MPLAGLADAIVDLVSSGNTLKANHLKAGRDHADFARLIKSSGTETES
jgi:ATP phosphoribosyltransferase